MASTVASNEETPPLNEPVRRRAATPQPERAAKDGAKRERETPSIPAELPQRLREALALAMLGVSLFLAAAVTTYAVSYRSGVPGQNVCGWVGHAIAGAIVVTIGKAAYVPILFTIVWSVILFLRGRIDGAVVRVFGIAVLTAALAVLLEHRLALGAVPGDWRGGLLGASVEPRIAQGFGIFGTYVVLGVLGAMAFTMATDFAFVPLVREAARGIGAAAREARSRAESLRSGRSWTERLLDALPRRKPADPSAPETALAAPGAFVEPVASVAAPPEPAAPQSVVLIPRRDAASDARAAEADLLAAEADTLAAEADVFDDEDPAPETGPGGSEPKPRTRAPRRRARGEGGAELPFPAPVYRLPEARLLDESKRVKPAETMGDSQAMAEQIESVLRSYGVDLKVVGHSRGPAVTLFELEMGPGVTVNTVTARRHDLAIRLKSGGVRFVYPIPGKSTVGVEVPNWKREFVRLRDLVDEVPPSRAKSAVPLYLGRDVMNHAVVEDLAEMPHLLIAGQTGSGKSACLNAILCSVLLARTPEEVKLILVDPKQVEFSKYDGVPHLMCPIVSLARKVPIVLDWVIAEMEERYTLLAQAGVRKISDFNALPKREVKERLGDAYPPEELRLRLPYLVVVVDEMNDLMVQAKKDMEDRITRIAQKSRAVGIHLILATQRPSVNVVTGTIKANLPTRIAFQTAQGNDSRVILDQVGAEDLLGKGDFLYKPPGTDKFVRAQGTWVGDEEIDRLVRHARALAEPKYDIRLVQIRDAADGAEGGASPEPTFDGGAKDALFDRAVEETINANRAAASHLQRAFAIGYNRATRILDAMAMLGIVSQYEGSKVRRILVTIEEWNARKEEILQGALRSKPGEGTGDGAGGDDA